MKVCLYLENPKLYKGCGIWKSFEHQEEELRFSNIKYTKSSTEDYDILLVNSTWLKSYLEIRRARRKNKKVIIYAHMTAEDFRNSMIFSNSLSNILRTWLNFFYSKADLVLAPSEYTKTLLKTRYSKLKDKKVISLSNGVDTDKWNPNVSRAKKFRKDFCLTRPLVLGVGMVFARKGILDFIGVAKRLEQFDFVWIGKYNQRVSNNRRINNALKNAPRNFKYLGYVKDILGAYSASDVFFFPSYEENEGIVVLEAAAMKRPLLLRNIPVFKSYLKEGESYISGKNEEEFVKKLGELMINKKKRLALGKGARNIALERNLRKNARKLKTILQGVFKDKT